jgi:hypothetical protein
MRCFRCATRTVAALTVLLALVLAPSAWANATLSDNGTTTLYQATLGDTDKFTVIGNAAQSFFNPNPVGGVAITGVTPCTSSGAGAATCPLHDATVASRTATTSSTSAVGRRRSPSTAARATIACSPRPCA